MVREIIHDPFILARKSEEATSADVQIGRDLLDTLRAHTHECVGMAANMIGVCKRIIVFTDGRKQVLMFNPVIISKEGEYTAKEGCLSLQGIRETKRADKIRVQFCDELMRTRTLTYKGFTAQIIQHEIDHCDGILI